MRYGAALLLALVPGCINPPNMRLAAASNEAAEEVRAAEREWSAAIDRRDAAAMQRFLAPNYFLAVAVQGRPLQIMPREAWLANLALYDIRTYRIDDMRVNVYGNAAIVTMLFTQDAVVGPERRERSAQFFLTDVWIRHSDGWRVTERHSSRPEQPPPGL